MTFTLWRTCWLAGMITSLLCATAGRAHDRVSETVHNLSVGGPGQLRAAEESRVCVFCHSSHNTQGVSPLWNRTLSPASYTIYDSSTFDANPGQPTGASKLCLSCHDGTIALGSVLSRSDQIAMAGGQFIPSGLTNLGTDLSDDHPISFHYTEGLAAADQQLVSPSTLQAEVQLDASGQLQCTACHDPHNNMYGDFMLIPSGFGTLCTVCHRMTGWMSSSHQTSSASVASSGSGDWPFSTVAENACRGCHRSHAAGGRERLLIFESEEDNCLCCHDGSVARTNIRAELDKITAHDPRRYFAAHDPAETYASGQVHVECADCHNPHAAASAGPPVGYVPIGPTLAFTKGINSGGGSADPAQYEYEVCYRCHADAAVPVPRRILRQVQQTNLRLKFSPGNPSYHPVAASSPSADTVSLIPALASGSLIRCTDCHNGESGPRAGGSGPDGPHGSAFDFLLERNYAVHDDTTESLNEYALCYKCHRRGSIITNQSFPLHREHIVEERAPCSACHDPHGINLAQSPYASDHTHLINFDAEIVRPDPLTQQMRFRDLGTYSGSCTLLCHGREHVDESY